MTEKMRAITALKKSDNKDDALSDIYMYQGMNPEQTSVTKQNSSRFKEQFADWKHLKNRQTSHLTITNPNTQPAKILDDWQ